MDLSLSILLGASLFGVGLCAGYLIGYPHGQKEREPSRPLPRTRLPPLPEPETWEPPPAPMSEFETVVNGGQRWPKGY